MQEAGPEAVHGADAGMRRGGRRRDDKRSNGGRDTKDMTDRHGWVLSLDVTLSRGRESFSKV
jgi:hypothetical protein